MMIKMYDISLGENSKQVCSICLNNIKKDMFRISFPYKTRFGKFYKRICEYCVLDIGEKIKDERQKKN